MDLVEWFNHSVSEENHDPLILIGIFIVVFLAIHRFRRRQRPPITRAGNIDRIACLLQFRVHPSEIQESRLRYSEGSISRAIASMFN